MITFQDYQVEDILRSDSSSTFVLESPHTVELANKIPVSGNTGIIMSQSLLGINTPFGEMLIKNKPEVSSHSLMNASLFPLQASCYVEVELHNKISEISKTRDPKTASLPTNKRIIKEAMSSDLGGEIISNFQKRFYKYINESQCRKFIICGVVAQVIFEMATLKEGWYHEVTQIVLGNTTVDVFYESHPSDLSGGGKSKWLTQNYLAELIVFLNKEDSTSVISTHLCGISKTTKTVSV